jgi:hypothetical protein
MGDAGVAEGTSPATSGPTPAEHLEFETEAAALTTLDINHAALRPLPVLSPAPAMDEPIDVDVEVGDFSTDDGEPQSLTPLAGLNADTIFVSL